MLMLGIYERCLDKPIPHIMIYNVVSQNMPFTLNKNNFTKSMHSLGRRGLVHTYRDNSQRLLFCLTSAGVEVAEGIRDKNKS